MESPWDGGTKVCSKSPGHITKMAAIPIYGKNLKKSSLKQKADDLETWYAASGARVLPILLNGDPELTLTCFKTRSNLVLYAFLWEKGKTILSSMI